MKNNPSNLPSQSAAEQPKSEASQVTRPTMKQRREKRMLSFRRNMVRVKHALAQEKQETREMLAIYRKYTQGKASKDEMRTANQQFVDLLKGVGLGIFAVLPFAPITIPIALKLGRWVGVDILPSSFQEAIDDAIDETKQTLTTNTQQAPIIKNIEEQIEETIAVTAAETIRETVQQTVEEKIDETIAKDGSHHTTASVKTTTTHAIDIKSNPKDGKS